MINPTRIADVGAGISAASAGFGLSLAHANEILQFVALVVSIIAGVAAGLYHYTQWKKNRGTD